jgi:GT2 family glycosyltransferase
VIAFPEVAEPRVSVVMVTHDAWEWIERSLAALGRHTPPVYEVIVVDNASPPAMVERLERELTGARLIRNAENAGFGPATNRGAAEARGEVLALINSDLEVHAGWLEPLLDVLDGEPGCAAVAPRVLNLDGTLQEAGAIVARDGTTAKLGDGDPADALAHRFRRRVDYAGAECLLVRREAFAAVGGFDAVYAPAYYEDADLCFALAAAGRSTLYEPRSVVTHAMHGSGGLGQAIRLTERNRPVFAARWAERLADRPPGVEPWRLRRQLEARDALAPARALLIGVAVAAPVGVRVTAVLDDPTCVAPAPEVELAAMPADWAAWLGSRRFFYDVVVGVSPLPDELDALVRETQPQAIRATGPLDHTRLSELLRAAGALA